MHEYHQIKPEASNIWTMQTEIMKEYIFYWVRVIVIYSSFQQNNLILFLSPILAFTTLKTVAEITKIAICLEAAW